jgi:hypothetical protein
MAGYVNPVSAGRSCGSPSRTLPSEPPAELALIDPEPFGDGGVQGNAEPLLLFYAIPNGNRRARFPELLQGISLFRRAIFKIRRMTPIARIRHPPTKVEGEP